MDAGDASQPPRELPVSTTHPNLSYELAEEFVADPSDSDPAASIRAATSGPDTREGAHSGPVYRRVPGGDMVVPTGRVLVRFNTGDAAADHQDEFRAVGYVVEQVLPYATHTAWLRAATGGVVPALRNLGRLSEVPGVVAVEPQMIGPSAKRG